MSDGDKPYTTEEVEVAQWWSESGDLDTETHDRILATVEALAEARAQLAGVLEEHKRGMAEAGKMVEAAQAAAAQMREALVEARKRARLGGTFAIELIDSFFSALSSSVGKGYVSPEKHEAGLREAWAKGHDSVIAGLTSEDKERRAADVARIVKGFV